MHAGRSDPRARTRLGPAYIGVARDDPKSPRHTRRTGRATSFFLHWEKFRRLNSAPYRIRASELTVCVDRALLWNRHGTNSERRHTARANAGTPRDQRSAFGIATIPNVAAWERQTHEHAVRLVVVLQRPQISLSVLITTFVIYLWLHGNWQIPKIP